MASLRASPAAPASAGAAGPRRAVCAPLRASAVVGGSRPSAPSLGGSSRPLRVCARASAPAASDAEAAASATGKAKRARPTPRPRKPAERAAPTGPASRRSDAADSAASRLAAAARTFRRELSRSETYTKRLVNDPPALEAMERHGVGYSSTGLIARMRVEAEARKQEAKMAKMESGEDEREAIEAVTKGGKGKGAVEGKSGGESAPAPSSAPVYSSSSSPRITVGSTEVVLAAAYGFCWGVERAVQMAYEARHRFPEATVHITNEIIHNPIVNEKLKGMDVQFIQTLEEAGKGAQGGGDEGAALAAAGHGAASVSSEGVTKDFSRVRAGDVVILPAFGASVQEMRALHARGARLVDTTCPWVSKVWNAVDNQARRGHTSVIHGKWAHEETLATASFAGAYVVVKDLKQAKRLAETYMVPREVYDESERQAAEAAKARAGAAGAAGTEAAQGAASGAAAASSSASPSSAPESLLSSFYREFANAHSAGFDPRVDLDRIGMANQTTMLKGETYAIGKLLEARQMERFGPDAINLHYMVMDTICDATQERQDAVTELVAHQAEDFALGNKLDALVVVGGFNSSNTSHLQEIGEFAGVPSFWVDSAARIDVERNAIEHKTAHGELVTTADWIPSVQDKPLFRVGVTSGASTPDRAVEDVLDKVFAIRDPGFQGVPRLDVPIGKPTHADAR